jgi:two-component system response regulator FixJ
MKNNGLLVAVIDDIESVRDALTMVLENQQWEALSYTSGEAFLADLKNHKLDCIVLDSHLPGKSGAEIAQSIISGANPIPIVVLTAYPNSPQTNEIKNMKIGKILVKPVSQKVLIEHIKAATNTA